MSRREQHHLAVVREQSQGIVVGRLDAYRHYHHIGASPVVDGLQLLDDVAAGRI